MDNSVCSKGAQISAKLNQKCFFFKNTPYFLASDLYSLYTIIPISLWKPYVSPLSPTYVYLTVFLTFPYSHIFPLFLFQVYQVSNLFPLLFLVSCNFKTLASSPAVWRSLLKRSWVSETSVCWCQDTCKTDQHLSDSQTLPSTRNVPEWARKSAAVYFPWQSCWPSDY